MLSNKVCPFWIMSQHFYVNRNYSYKLRIKCAWSVWNFIVKSNLSQHLVWIEHSRKQLKNLFSWFRLFIVIFALHLWNLISKVNINNEKKTNKEKKNKKLLKKNEIVQRFFMFFFNSSTETKKKKKKKQ